MEQILSFIQAHGLPVFVIASCIIAFIGVLKLCKVFDKITNKNVKKFIYYALDIVLSFGGSAIYFAIFHKPFKTYLVYSVAQLSSTTALYAVYENLGLRKLVQIALNWIAGLFKSDKVKALAKKLGLSDEFISKLTGELATVAKDASAKEVKQAQNQAIAIIKDADKEIKADKKADEQKKAQEAKVQEKTTAEQTDAQYKAKVASVKVKILAERQKQEQQQK